MGDSSNDSCSIARPGFERPDLSQLGEWLAPAQIETIAAHILETPLIAISATEIRRRVRAGLSPRYLVPAAVGECIERRGLYADS